MTCETEPLSTRRIEDSCTSLCTLPREESRSRIVTLPFAYQVRGVYRKYEICTSVYNLDGRHDKLGADIKDYPRPGSLCKR